MFSPDIGWVVGSFLDAKITHVRSMTELTQMVDLFRLGSDQHKDILRYATWNNHLDIIQHVLPKYELKKNNKTQLMNMAIFHGHVGVVRLFMADGRFRISSLDMLYAARGGQVDIVRLLLPDPRVMVDEDNYYSFRAAASNGHIEVVRVLLEDPRVNPAAQNNEAIRQASENGHLEIVRLLLNDSRVDPSELENWAIRFACKNKHKEVVRLIMADQRVMSTIPNIIRLRCLEMLGE